MLHAVARSIAWLLALLVITIGSAALAPRLSTSSPLRTADQLWRDGHASQAWAAYTQLRDHNTLPPYAQLRLAGLALERGACGDAELLGARVLGQRPTRDEAAVAHLIRAECATRREAWQTAAAAWTAIDVASPWEALAQVLQGEHALHNGDARTAIEHFDSALRHDLPAPWAALAHLRLAQASADGAAARQHLEAIPATLPTPDPMSRPLLPLTPWVIEAQAASLRAVLAAPRGDQAQLRGQHLLDAQLWRLAMAHFDQLAQQQPNDPHAPAYAAYARYQTGERRAATDTARVLHQRFPTDPFVTTLYATFAFQTGDVNTAAALVERAALEQPLDPALAIVRSDIFAAQHRYADAVAERRRARDIAPAAQRGRYAVALAQQYLDLVYNVCSDGSTAAQEAVAIAPTDGQAWQILVAVHYHCARYVDAISAAQQGLEHAPNEPALQFFLGSALWEAGWRDEGRGHLIQAADLAPTSEWRKRAEHILNTED